MKLFALSCNSDFGKDYKNIEIRVNNRNYHSQASKDFINALESEKEVIMRLYKLDNDLYNKLACYSFGIMGNESSYARTLTEDFDIYLKSGKSKTHKEFLSKLSLFKTTLKYQTKEEFPYAVAFVKEWKRNVYDKSFHFYNKTKDHIGTAKSLLLTYFLYQSKNFILTNKFFSNEIKTTFNSRGPTQIKRIPRKIKEEYGYVKEDLNDPYISAIATMGFLAQSLKQLNNYKIPRSEYLNYLHYIYMGSVSQIKNKTATPNKNIYLRNIRKYMSEVDIIQNN